MDQGEGFTSPSVDRKELIEQRMQMLAALLNQMNQGGELESEELDLPPAQSLDRKVSIYDELPFLKRIVGWLYRIHLSQSSVARFFTHRVK
ncbi:hypothetical protein ACFO9Q_22740 [Paenibacillus sp. GCM10023252]|uniref:hypothetical protein n=1 Tax=Paenibacillus sp. GCM10023252 TaxID=3252649 RepID=UPI003620E3D5